MKQGVILRDEFLSFMNVTPNTETASYNLIGEGFNELTEALNPKTKDTNYVHQKSGTSSIIGYAPTFDFTAENFAGDSVADFVAEVGRDRKVGSDCETDIINVCYFKAGKTEGSYKAKQQKIAIKVDQVNGGPGGEAMSMTGAFLYKGDAISGEWNDTTKKFTADTEVTPAVLKTEPKMAVK